MIFEKIETNEFYGRFIDIGLENVAMAAARVVDLPPRCTNKEVKSVDVYKTPARVILLVTAGPFRRGGP